VRIGQGIDVHRVSAESDRALWLGLVRVPDAPGLDGHSDADVATHALCDALLGAANLGDLGRHFPDSDPAFRDVPSRRLLEATVALVHAQGYHVISGDVHDHRGTSEVGALLAGDVEGAFECRGGHRVGQGDDGGRTGRAGPRRGHWSECRRLDRGPGLSPRAAPRRGGSDRSARPDGRRAAPRGAPRRTSPAREGLGGDQVEGRHAVLELLRAKRRTVQRILIAEAQDASDVLDAIEFEAQRPTGPVQLVSMARLDREAKTEGHQGVRPSRRRFPRSPLDDLLGVKRPFYELGSL